MPTTKKPTKKITIKPQPKRAVKIPQPDPIVVTAPAKPPETVPVVPPTFPAKSTVKQRGKLKLILRIISPILFILGLYLVIYPFWPSIQYKLWPPHQENAVTAPLDSQITIPIAPAPIVHKAVDGGNKIIIPKIGVDMKMIEGTNETIALNQGAWRMPQTSTPDQGGNTVITAHRFKYKPPSEKTFYLLDKLVVGDAVTVNWQGYEYNYKVTGTKIVEPSAVEVLDNTENPQITLITCTPLFTTKQRLIVIAEPIE